MHDLKFSQGFLGNQSFNKKIKLVFVRTNKFWKFKLYLNTYQNLKNNPNAMKWLQSWVLAAWIMRNHFAYLHQRKQSLSILNVYIWNEERPSLIILSQILKIPCSPLLSLMHFSWKITLTRITPYTRGQVQKILDN
jgi:hypothetical protein